MIPWNKVPMDEFKQLVDDEANLQKLIEHVKNMEFVLAMGVRDKDLLISIGSSVDCIKNLGSRRTAYRPAGIQTAGKIRR